MPRIDPPVPGEYLPYYDRYLEQLPPGDVYPLLERQAGAVPKLLGSADETLAAYRYAPGKWSVKEVVGHLSDCERVFAYRALCFARADATELPGFDENAWASSSDCDRRALAELIAEWSAVRAATLALFGALDEAALKRRGTANGGPSSVRALAAIIAAHTRHHVVLLRERYGLTG